MRRILMTFQDLVYRLIWRLRNGTKISLLSFFTTNCKFGKNALVERMCILHNSTLGDFSYIGDGTRVINTTIGRFCSIGGEVQIGLGRHPLNMVSSSPVFFSNKNALRTKWVKSEITFNEYLPTVIGNDVWIGTRVLVRDGVHIGDGSIIGAGAIITKDVEPYSIMVGAPARCIRKRFSDENIDKLEKIAWWNWSIDTIKENVDVFSEVENFLQIKGKNT